MSKGIITTYVLVFGAIFLLLLSGLLGFILLQLRQSNQEISWNETLHLAEAGANYYRWCLNHEIEGQCSTQKDYFDLAGNLIGQFSLAVSQRSSCGEIAERSILSTGSPAKFPGTERKVSVLYGRTSVAKYPYVLNSNVWVGADHEIRGPYHSNGGIRMDGENQSLVTSAAPNGEWVCTSSFGCGVCPTANGCRVAGSQCICPGVFTTTNNSNPDLFSFPVPPFDFVGITADLARLKSVAQTPDLGGIYLQPSVNIDSQGKGYHVKLKIDQGIPKVEIWLITQLSSTYAYSLEEGWHYDYFTISSEYLYNTYTISSACSVIFVEDNIWPEGQVKGKVTLASANLINPNLDTDVVLPGNIDYTTSDGSDGLALIGERNVLIGPQSPNQMELKGIFIAQKGRFSRNHYPGNFREKLEISGSIISNGRVGTQWISGSQTVSGYLERESYYDPDLVYGPPPFVPYVEPEFKIVNWEEVE